MTEVDRAPKGASSGRDEVEPLLELRGIDKRWAGAGTIRGGPGPVRG